MSNPIIGAVSLTDKTGVFLGSVNLNNLNATAGELLYSPDGFSLDGLAIADGLQIQGTTIKTVGNPAIQLTSNSLYVNDNVGATPIQTAINAVEQADTIFISSGSYGEAITITDKYNISLINPSCNAGTICEVLNGLTVNGTSELIRISNLQIKGSNATLKGVGRCLYTNLNFTGASALSRLAVEIGNSSTKYMTFTNCSFNQYCDITIPSNFASVLYFINCDFGGATLTINTSLATRVILNNCAGLTAYPASSKAVLIGLNVLSSGASQVNTYDLKTTLINGSAYPPAAAGLSMDNQAEGRIPFCSNAVDNLNGDSAFTYDVATKTLNLTNPFHININGVQPASNLALCSDGEVGGMKYVPIIDTGMRYVNSFTGQQTAKSDTANPPVPATITLFETTELTLGTAPLETFLDCIFNFHVTGGEDVLTLDLYDKTLDPVEIVQTYTFTIPSGNSTIPVKFRYTSNNPYQYNFKITGSIATHTISTATNEYYSVYVTQLVLP